MAQLLIMGTSLPPSLLKVALSLTTIRGVHRAICVYSQRPSYALYQWLRIQSSTLCHYHNRVLGYAATHPRLYSSMAVPHDAKNKGPQERSDDQRTPDAAANQFNPDRTIGLTKAHQRKLLHKSPEHLDESRILKVAIIGAPNAGKSTLANTLMGWRFASVSKKVHTTRHRAIGVLTEGDTQIVFLDTPGMITPGKRRRHRLEMSLLTDPHSVLYEADIIAVIVDVSNVWHRTKIEEEVIKALHLHQAKPSILVLNKVDRLKKKQELLNITRVLTDGIVGGQRNWSTVKPEKNRVDIESLFEKMDAKKVTSHDSRNSSNSSLNRSKADYDNIHDPDPLKKCRADASHDLESDFDRMMTSNERGLAESALATLDAGIVSNDADKDGAKTNNDESFVGKIEVEDGTTIEVHGTSEDELTKFLAGEKIDLDDDGKNPDGGVAPAEWSETATRGQQQPDLRNQEVWREYYQKIRKAETEVGEKRGWGKFDAVFMLSALEGDGVVDLKNYLLESAVSGPWQFHSSLVTDQDPIEIARMCVWEKMLDHLPEEIPYQIKIRLALWEVDEDNMLRATFELLCDTKRQMFAALGKGGQTAKLIAGEAKQDLMNTFRRDLSLKLGIRCKGATR